jgi:hypothetical protein
LHHFRYKQVVKGAFVAQLIVPNTADPEQSAADKHTTTNGLGELMVRVQLSAAVGLALIKLQQIPEFTVDEGECQL